MLLLSATALLHRLLWPMMSRVLYRLADLGIHKRRVFFFEIGKSLIAIASAALLFKSESMNWAFDALRTLVATK